MTLAFNVFSEDYHLGGKVTMSSDEMSCVMLENSNLSQERLNFAMCDRELETENITTTIILCLKLRIVIDKKFISQFVMFR